MQPISLWLSSVTLKSLPETVCNDQAEVSFGVHASLGNDFLSYHYMKLTPDGDVLRTTMYRLDPLAHWRSSRRPISSRSAQSSRADFRCGFVNGRNANRQM